MPGSEFVTSPVEAVVPDRGVLPFAADLMMRTEAQLTPSARTIIPTTSQRRTTHGTVDRGGRTDTVSDVEEQLDTTGD